MPLSLTLTSYSSVHYFLVSMFSGCEYSVLQSFQTLLPFCTTPLTNALQMDIANLSSFQIYGTHVVLRESGD